MTSVIDDIRIWVDSADSNPGQDLWQILEEQECRGRGLGVELDALCLTGKRWEDVRAAIEVRCECEDSSELVSRLRLVKSEGELEYIRKAAALADDALMAVQRLAKPGTQEQVVLAGMQSVVFQGGGDYPASHFIIGSGENALMVRSFSGYRTLGAKDQLQLEFGGTYRQYHPCLMRTILTGEPSQHQLPMHAACWDALQASKAADRPGFHLRRYFRRPRRFPGPFRFRGTPAQRLWVQPGSFVPANLDGLAHEIQG